MTLGALVVLEVHAKDALAELIANRTNSVSDFDWVA
jgi:dynein heavy chain